MTRRISIPDLAPEAYKAFVGVETYLAKSPLPQSTIHLVKLRASQINGCAYCVDLHSRDAKKEGESDERLWQTAVWRESPLFTPAERAALALTEEATRLADRQAVPDSVWEEAAAHYSQEELAALVVAVAMINAWNRIGVTCRLVPGS